MRNIRGAIFVQQDDSAYMLKIFSSLILGNPGRAGSGSAIFKSTIDDSAQEKNEKCILVGAEEIWSGYHYLGESVTNNVAEYSGLIEGLKQAVRMRLPALLIQGNAFCLLFIIPKLPFGKFDEQ